MKSSTTNDDNIEPTTQDKAARPSGLRYFFASNAKIAVLALLIFIVLWLALELLFPRLTRAESPTVPAAELPETELVTEEVTYPRATKTVLMDQAKGGTLKWTVYPVFNKPGASGCRIQAAEGAGTAMKTPPSVDFEFVYGDAVEFYKETVPVKVARFLDIFRAPEAARDQLELKLYDVDGLSAQGYKKLLEGFEPMLQNASAKAEGAGERNPPEPILAFVTGVNTTPSTTISTWHAAAGKAGKFEFIGAPVQWNAGVVDLLRYGAGKSDFYTKLNECAENSTTTLIKRAMYDVIASAEGIKEEGQSDSERFVESDAAKMYLAIMSKANTLAVHVKEVKPIPTVSFRSAWDGALTQKQQAIASEQGQGQSN